MLLLLEKENLSHLKYFGKLSSSQIFWKIVVVSGVGKNHCVSNVLENCCHHGVLVLFELGVKAQTLVLLELGVKVPNLGVPLCRVVWCFGVVGLGVKAQFWWYSVIDFWCVTL